MNKDFPILPQALTGQASKTFDEQVTDVLADLLADLPAKKMKMPAPPKRNQNMKTSKAQAVDLLADLIPRAPVNPAYVWTAEEIVITLITHRCTCGISHSVPCPAMVRWTRPYGKQSITNRRFPREWEHLPRRVESGPDTLLNGCHICMAFAPTEIGESPLGPDDTDTRRPEVLGGVPERDDNPTVGIDLLDTL